MRPHLPVSWNCFLPWESDGMERTVGRNNGGTWTNTHWSWVDFGLPGRRDFFQPWKRNGNTQGIEIQVHIQLALLSHVNYLCCCTTWLPGKAPHANSRFQTSSSGVVTSHVKFGYHAAFYYQPSSPHNNHQHRPNLRPSSICRSQTCYHQSTP